MSPEVETEPRTKRMASFLERETQLDELPLLSKVLPLPHHVFGVVSDTYATAYDCSLLRDDIGETSVDSCSALLKEIKEFYDEYGYVVLQGVYGEQDCALTRDAMWTILEEANPGLRRDDAQSWTGLAVKGRYGLSMRGPSFHPQFIRNRQHPVFVHLLALLTESSDDRDVIVSHDRFTIYRATLQATDEQTAATFVTGDRNLHLDLPPWWWEEDSVDVVKGLRTLQYDDNQDFVKENNLIVQSLGRHVQCVLNFADNVDADGGTIVVPYFHRFMRKWTDKHKDIRKPLPWVTLPRAVEDEYMPYAHRISMKEGSVLIWDQRVLHGTSPNHSTRCRLAQYCKAGPRHLTYAQRDENGHFIESSKEQSDNTVASCGDDERLQRRARALRRELIKSGGWDHVSPLGKAVFALDVLPPEDQPPCHLTE